MRNYEESAGKIRDYGDERIATKLMKRELARAQEKEIRRALLYSHKCDVNTLVDRKLSDTQREQVEM